MTLQSQSFGSGQWFETDIDFIKELGRVKGDAVHFRFIEVEPVEVEQVTYQFQQMFRRTFHIIEIEALAFVLGQSGQKFGISHDRAQRRFKVMSDASISFSRAMSRSSARLLAISSSRR